MKKLFSFFLVITMLFVFSGCEKQKDNTSSVVSVKKEEVKESAPINLLYNKADSFNPYTAVTENNRNLCKLIFEPLVKTDNNFNPILRIASDIKLEGTKCFVTLKDAYFSDGSPVTSNDVLYSYNIAKTYGGLYTSHLYEVKSLSVESSKTLTFNLVRSDPFFKNLLDFPIFKSGSEKRTDTDGVLLPPIGCGRYCVSNDKSKLTLNDNFFGIKGKIKEINLINAPDEDSISHYIEIGATELYYTDLSNQNVVRMSGKKTEVNLNNLVFVGINSKVSGLSNKNLRYAISSAIDRSAICSSVYFNNATPATGYFNTCLKEVSAVQSIKSIQDTQITVENLSKIGYNSKDSEGYFVNKGGKRLILRLLVNKDNRFHALVANSISSQLKSAGIQIKVIETSFADYVKCTKSNAFDLYLGEVSILPNFDMSSLVSVGGSVSFGLEATKPAKTEENSDNTADKDKKEENKEEQKENSKQNDDIKNIINNFYSGKASLNDVASTLITEMPQIPVLYKKGMLFYKDNIKSGVESTESDIYYSIENYITE